MERVLVTGGTGAIGRETVDLLIKTGYRVTLFTRKPRGKLPYALSKVRIVKGDICNLSQVTRAVTGQEAVIHLAAVLGGSKSLDNIRDFVNVNTLGMSTLLKALTKSRTTRRLILASSFVVYGEGTYRCEGCQKYEYPNSRSKERLTEGDFEHHCPICASILRPVPTDEKKQLEPLSVYAMTKRHQEDLARLVARAHGLQVAILRFSNVYGQDTSATGVYSRLVSRILRKKPPMLYEDGAQRRDFLHVTDAARANVLALEKDPFAAETVNIGTGVNITIREAAQCLIEGAEVSLKPHVSGQFRLTDVRHCFPDISRAEKVFGFKPTVKTTEGLRELAKRAWTQSSSRT